MAHQARILGVIENFLRDQIDFLPMYHGAFSEKLDARCFIHRTSDCNLGAEISKIHQKEELEFFFRGRGEIFRGHVGVEPSFY